MNSELFYINVIVMFTIVSCLLHQHVGHHDANSTTRLHQQVMILTDVPEGVDGSKTRRNVIVRDPPTTSGNEMAVRSILILNSYIHLHRDFRCTGLCGPSRIRTASHVSPTTP